MGSSYLLGRRESECEDEEEYVSRVDPLGRLAKSALSSDDDDHQQPLLLLFYVALLSLLAFFYYAVQYSFYFPLPTFMTTQ